MTSGEHDRMLDILGEALELPTEQRGAFLDTACAGAPALRSQVERLLGIEQAAAAAIPTRHAHDAGFAQAILPPKQIGPYKIVSEIGHGGMGAVYLAMQQSPVRRAVAIKLLLPGMDTRQVLTRFETERQALAMMSHPNVAQVYDAGATDAGRPYFVMEYVDGLPITEYCDSKRLTTPQRIELFIQVCNAIGHAHQKAIIHRDVKPSNVIVMERDGVAIPKVIDFGIAKATDQRGIEQTQFTEHGQLIGTPEYMSPEQASAGSTDVDTRSDVYSLGVLLYELLTGALPFDRKALRESAYDEIRRIIREVDPPKPSTRLSELGPAGQSIAQARQADAQTHLRHVRGELDWITMRALEKDRARRYDSPASLAADLERHLRNEPVEAGPQSRLYVARRFVRRHRAAVLTVAIVVATLLTGIGTTSWQAVRARRAERVALEQKSLAERRFGDLRKLAGTFLFEIDELIQSGGPTKGRQKLVDVANEYLSQLTRESPDDSLTGESIRGHIKVGFVQYYPGYPHLGNPQGAAESYATALKLARQLYARKPLSINAKAEVGKSLMFLSKAQAALGQFQPALDSLTEARVIYEDLSARDGSTPDWPRNVAMSIDHSADIYKSLNDGDKALAALRESLPRYEKVAADFPGKTFLLRDVWIAHSGLASLLMNMGRPGEAIDHVRIATSRATELLELDPDNPQNKLDMRSESRLLCETLLAAGLGSEAVALLPPVLEQAREHLAKDPSNYHARREVANLLRVQGQALAAVGRFRQCIAVWNESLAVHMELSKVDPTDHFIANETANVQRFLASAYLETGELDFALTMARDSLALHQKIRSGKQQLEPSISLSRRVIAEVLQESGQLDSALEMLRAAAQSYPNSTTQPAADAPHSREFVFVLSVQSEAARRHGRADDAARFAHEGIELADAILSAGTQDSCIAAWRAKMVITRVRLALDAKDFPAAVADAHSAIESGRKLVSVDPAAIDFRAVLAAALELQGDIAFAQANHPAAAAVYEQACSEWIAAADQTTDWPKPATAIKRLREKLLAMR